MSPNRRLEYDKGPRLDAEVESRGDDGSDPDDRDESGDDDRILTTVPPWTAGFVSGASAFALVFAVTYQLVAAMFATGAFRGAETEPSRVVITGFVALASHGAMIESGGEPIRMAFSARLTAGLASHLTPLIPILVLFAVGYSLVRYVPLETRREAGLAIGTSAATYAALMIGLATMSEWSPQERPDAETIAVAVDAATVVSIARTALVFVAIGAAVAALPRYVGTESADPDADSGDEPAAEAA